MLNKISVAAKTNNTEELRKLLKECSGDFISLQDLIDDIALCGSTHIEVMHLLLVASKGKNYSFQNAINTASKNGHKEIVELLLHADACKSNLQGAIDMASRNGHKEIVVLLLQADAGKSNLQWAINSASRYGHKEIVVLLLQADEG